MSRHGKKKLSFQHNPYEMAICGYSGSGKTTLLEKLISSLRVDYKVAYMKSDCHKFEVDKKGKDTYRAAVAGAENIVITDKKRQVCIKNNLGDSQDLSFGALEADLVLIEGWKHDGKLPKVLLLDEEGKALNELLNEGFENVVAVAGCSTRPESLPKCFPYFHRDDLTAIKSFILDFFSSRPIKLKALILSGGFSTRMKKDKCAIEYHGKSQLAYAAELLSHYCDEVYLSCREDQVLPIDASNYMPLADRFIGMGPSSGIMTAFEKDPEAAWLVMGCDLPFVDQEAVKCLIKGRNKMRFATAFIDPQNQFPEPLLAIYEPKSRVRFLQFMANMQNCPRKVLINSPCSLLSQNGQAWLENVNTPEEYENALKRLSHV